MAKKEALKGHFESLRQRAEKLAGQDKADIASLSREDIENLAHELAVHQIELEVQNEELRQTQTKLAEARDRYADLYDFAPLGYLTLDKNNLVVEANLTICNMLGVDRSELFRKRISDHIDPESQDDFYYHLRETRRSGTKTVGEIKVLKANGAAFYAQFESLLAGDNSLRIAIIDITEQRQAREVLARTRDELEIKVQERTGQLQEAYNEILRAQEFLKESNQQLKVFGHRITQIQEAERKRIAYELHDDTAQYLSILKMQLTALVQSNKIQSPEVVEKLKFLEKDADRAFHDVRRYSHELRPSVLDHMGLRASLEQTAEDINKLNHFTLEIEVEGREPRLSEDVKLGFFRIAQEAINNIRKHSKADKAVIHLKFQKKQISMRIIDDGIGFNPKEAKTRSGKKGSLGLLSMKERADLIGARLKIDSLPGKGTTVKVEMK